MPEGSTFTLVDRLNWWLGRLASRTQLNHIDCEPPTSAHAGRVRKKRKRFANLKIFLGNLYAHLMREPIRVLFTRQWQAREQQIHRVLYDVEVTLDAQGWLQIPWHGTALSSLLQDPFRSAQDRLQAIQTTARELHRIHQLVLPDAKGEPKMFSHADAGARNVALSESLDRAVWFDFELVHAASMTLAERQADDLRAFLYSTLACLPDSEQAQALQLILACEFDPTVIETLKNLIQNDLLRCNTFHLAQIQLPLAVHAKINRQILDQL